MKYLRCLWLLGFAIITVAAAEAASPRKNLVMVVAERVTSTAPKAGSGRGPYSTGDTLPVFAAQHLEKEFRVTMVYGSTEPGRHSLPGIEAVAEADVLLISVRRRFPSPDELNIIRRHIQAGKPVVGIRTASHAFAQSRPEPLPAGQSDWSKWDAEVIGGNYSGHHDSGGVVTITASGAHTILRGITLPFTSKGSLYRASPLQHGATTLLIGTLEGQKPEPVAWTCTHVGGGRSFYTSLGTPEDFADPSFQQLLANGIRWAAGN